MGNHKQQKCRLVVALFILGWAIGLPCAGARPGIRIEPPTGDRYLLDYAQIIDESDEARITYLARTLQEEAGIPVYVVTINTMLAHSSSVMSIETYARALFEQWGRDETFTARERWRWGILLLVSKGDRKARIELGRDWKGEVDPHCQQIMSHIMVPAFRDGQYSEGVLKGLRALDRLARGDRPRLGPSPGETITLILVLAGFFSLIALYIYGLFAGWFPKGSGGSSDYDSWDSDYSGGGGYSGGGSYGGGGGATGSW